MNNGNEMKAYKKGISKSEFLGELKKHQALDAFLVGTYEDNELDHFRGCAVGCSLESVARLKGIEIEYDDHSQYPKHLGIPQWLAQVEDRIFEGVSPARRKTWPIEFGEAIQEGADLSKALYPYLIMVCTEALKYFDHARYPNVKSSIDDVIEALRAGVTDQDQLLGLRKAVYAAAYAAAYATAAAAADAAAAACAAYYAAAATAEAACAAYYAAAATAEAACAAYYATATYYAANAADTATCYAAYAANAANAADIVIYYAAYAADTDASTKTYELLADNLLEILRGIKC